LVILYKFVCRKVRIQLVVYIYKFKKMKSLKEFINEELQNSTTIIKENTEQSNENKNVQESENAEVKETEKE